MTEPTPAQMRMLAEAARRAMQEAANSQPVLDAVREALRHMPVEPVKRDFDVSWPWVDIGPSDIFRPRVDEVSQLSEQALRYVTPPVVDVSWIMREVPVVVPSLELPWIPDLVTIVSTVRELAYPANWPTGSDRPGFALAQQIVENEGIPIAYVPRAKVVSELAKAADRAERGRILVGRTPEILIDCAAALDRTLDPAVEAQKWLILGGVRTLESGHHEAAQALCVNVCSTLIEAHIDGRHGKAKNMCRASGLKEAFESNQLRYKLGVAPVVNLLTDWHPKSGKPRPVELSRHVVAHQAHPDHFTPENAILAVMVATSLILALDERYSWPGSNPSQ